LAESDPLRREIENAGAILFEALKKVRIDAGILREKRAELQRYGHDA
jgi:hypothetical protein